MLNQRMSARRGNLPINPPSRDVWAVGGTVGYRRRASGFWKPNPKKGHTSAAVLAGPIQSELVLGQPPVPKVGSNTGPRSGTPARAGLGHRSSGRQGGLRLREVNGTAALEGNGWNHRLLWIVGNPYGVVWPI